MIGEFDPNGAIREYRLHLQRKANTRTLFFCSVIGIGMIVLFALVVIGMSIVERWKS